MFHCYVKIAYYIALISYHFIDIISDWIKFSSEVGDHARFAGVPNNNTAIEVILGISCGFGLICSLAMVIIYGYYIHFHWECSQKANYRLLNTVQFQGDTLLNCKDDNEGKTLTCNRHFVLTELVISNIELYLKDDVQSALLIYMYCISQNDSSSIIQPGRGDILFAVCSIVASLKLCICFSTKLFGLGSGEKMADCESHKCCCCVLGIIGSVISGVLCILYLSLSLDQT